LIVVLFMSLSFCFRHLRPLISHLFPYTTLFRSHSLCFKNSFSDFLSTFVSVFVILNSSGTRFSSRKTTLGGLLRILIVNNPPSVDRKSTRLNSSHVSISYADFLLKNNTTTTATH